MDLVNEHGVPLNRGLHLVDDKAPKRQTTKEAGEDLAHFLLDKASKLDTDERINQQFEILRYAALDILAHYITNIALGVANPDPKRFIGWDPTIAFSTEKDVQERLTETCLEWKKKFMDGELTYKPSKDKL